MSEKKFFPEFLNKGSQGPAVALLQALLLFGEFNDSIIVDGDYGDETAKGVVALQKTLGIEQDGNFGPDTRAQLNKLSGFDANLIPLSAFQGETVAVQP